MAVAAVVAHFLEELLAQVELVAVEMPVLVELIIQAPQEAHLLAVEVAVEQIMESPVETVALAALVSSSSRPTNNEGAWKLKFIGCMESTPQCTC
jgi:hypothetical protein